MKKKLLSMLLALCMVVTLLPIVAFAESDVMTVQIGTGEPTTYQSFETGWNAAASADNGTPVIVTLLANWTADSENHSFGSGIGFGHGEERSGNIRVPGGKTITLDLKGKTIDRRLTSATDYGSVIRIEGGALTLTDSSTTVIEDQGKITGAYNKDGGAVEVLWLGMGTFKYDGSLLMTGGNITGNHTGKDVSGGGGSVYLTSNFTMLGGSITGNYVHNANSAGGVLMTGYNQFTVGGTAVIKDNTNSTPSSTRNVYLKKGRTITCSTETPLTAGAHIGVTMAESPDSPIVAITTASNADYSSYFHNDKGGKSKVVNSGSGNNQIVKLMTDVVTVTVNSISTNYSTFEEGWNAAITADTATVTLNADWVASDGSFGTGSGFGDGTEIGTGYILVPIDKTITLNLNGKTIDRGLTQGVTNGNVMTAIGHLTIVDNSSTDVSRQGIITGGYNSTEGDSSGGGVVLSDGSALTLEGGNISGNKSAGWGGGVKNEGTTFTMTGGKISGNIANYGSATYVVFNNCGGGVYSGTSFTMTGGEISGNSVCGSGNGLKGGGVFFYENAIVGGTAVIRDNKSGCTYSVPDGTSVGIVSGGITDNVYLQTGQTVACSTVTPLASGANIGVTTQTAPAIGAPVTITGTDGLGQTSYFHSDSFGEVISTDGIGLQLSVTAPGAPTIGTATAGDGQATVSFTAPASNGGATITGYTVTSSPGGFTGIGTTSPITVTGLTNGTAYTFTVTATNAFGTSEASSSNSVTLLLPREATPNASFTATGADTGMLSNVTDAMKYSVDGGSTWLSVSGTTMDITGVTATNGVKVYQPGNNNTTRDSNVQSITITKAATPNASFTATGADTGMLSNVTDAMKYSVDGGSTWLSVSGTTMDITGVTATNGVKVYQPGATTTTLDSDVKTITITKAATPTTADKTDCTTSANNDGKLIGVTTAMEYKLSTGSIWTVGTGSDITGLGNGTYDVRVKATGTVLASGNQTLTIAPYIPPSGGGYTPSGPVTHIDNGGSTTGSNLDRLVSGGKTLTVEGTNGAKLVFSPEALKGITEQTSGSIKVEMKDVSSTHQENLPGKQVFSLTVFSGSSTITNFNGAVTVTLPYTLKDGETADEVTVWYLASDGTMTEIPCTYDSVTGLATFTVTHFSLYVVGVPWVNPFTDVKESDWFYGAVEFANRNGLFAGTDTASFSPNSAMTRAMLWTVLGRLGGQSLSGSGAFDAARSWAMGAGITDGTNPDGSITREQMVTILWRYAGSLKTGGDLSTFSDGGSVAGYAEDAMAWAVENGIVSGINGALMPQDNATRVQVATILKRFIEATK